MGFLVLILIVILVLLLPIFIGAFLSFLFSGNEKKINHSFFLLSFIFTSIISSKSLFIYLQKYEVKDINMYLILNSFSTIIAAFFIQKYISLGYDLYIKINNGGQVPLK